MDEIESMNSLKVFELVKKPVGVKMVDRRWVFSVKTDENNEILKFKSRLVAKGFTQIEGIDYFDTFAPVVKAKSPQMVQALANKSNWKVYQMDVKTTFLNSELKEDVYMEQPEGFIDQVPPHDIWKLNAALNCLKQASMAETNRISTD